MFEDIGKHIYRLRVQAGYTQAELCRGICSVVQFSRIETGKLIPQFFLLDRFLGRLGESVRGMEYILPLETYELYEFRHKVQMHICHGRFRTAEQLLTEYEKKDMWMKTCRCSLLNRKEHRLPGCAKIIKRRR